MVSFDTLLTVIPVVSLVLVGVYYSLQIRNQNRTRQAQLYMPIYARFQEKDFSKKFINILYLWEWDTPQEFYEKYGPRADIDAYSDFMNITSFFTGIGVLVKRKLMNPEVVNDLMGDVLVRFWERYEDYFNYIREIRDWPTLGEHFEYLYRVMKPLQEQHASKPNT